MRYTVQYNYAGRMHYLHTDDFGTAQATAIALVTHKETTVDIWGGGPGQCGHFYIDWENSRKPCGLAFPTSEQYRRYMDADVLEQLAMLSA